MTPQPQQVGYEWSEAGERLLALFNREIDKNGGRERLADIVECELIKAHRQNKTIWVRPSERTDYWTSDLDAIIIANYHKFTALEIYAMLKKERTFDAVKGRILSLRRKGLLTYKKPSFL